jgi:hypothetical protein
MYTWFCKKLPRPLVNTFYCLWYAALIVLIVYFSGLPQAQLVYLHG